MIHPRYKLYLVTEDLYRPCIQTFNELPRVTDPNDDVFDIVLGVNLSRVPKHSGPIYPPSKFVSRNARAIRLCRWKLYDDPLYIGVELWTLERGANVYDIVREPVPFDT